MERMSEIPEHVPAFWALMKEVGINVTNRSMTQTQSDSADLAALTDWKMEWYADLKQFILTHGVTRIDTVINGMSTWIARGGPPGQQTHELEPAKRELSEVEHLTLSEHQQTVARERAERHVAAVQETGEDVLDMVLRCSPDSHLKRGCPWVDFGIFLNPEVTPEEKTETKRIVKEGYSRA